MALKFPESMDECVYFTNRILGNGSATAWVFRGICPKCKKGTMGKPKDDKTGSVKIRAKEYQCPNCQNTIEKQVYEDSLTANIKYVCPECKKEGETQIPFKRKNIAGVPTLRANCEKCKANIDITKKMAEPKKKKSKLEEDD